VDHANLRHTAISDRNGILRRRIWLSVLEQASHKNRDKSSCVLCCEFRVHVWSVVIASLRHQIISDRNGILRRCIWLPVRKQANDKK
jgi:hypothetical protein